MKKCSSCNIDKQESDFPKDKKRKDGLYTYCKSCVSIKSKKSYHSNLIKNRELKKVRARNNKTKNQERNKIWYQENKEHKKEYSNNYRSENQGYYKEYQNKWNKNNPDKVKSKQQKFCKSSKGKLSTRQRNHNHKARLRGAEGKHTYKEWENLKKQFDYTCQMCFKKEPEIKLTRDHIIPISKGGNNYISNIQPLCGSCNSRKKDKILHHD